VEEVSSHSIKHQEKRKTNTKLTLTLLLLLVTTTIISVATVNATPIAGPTQATPSAPQQDSNSQNEANREDPPPATSTYLSTYWARTYGGNGDDEAFSVQQTLDGGYVVAGYTNSSGAGGNDAWVLKLNSTGGVTWQNTYGDTGDDRAQCVEQTYDGGYIVAGATNSSGEGSYDAWVLKLNSTGGVTWQKTYGGNGNDGPLSVQQTLDGGYIVVGYTNSSGAIGYDFWVLKLDSSGDVAWQKTYGDIGDEYARCVQQTTDGGFVVTGYTNSPGGVYYDVWVLKLDSNGSVTWQKTYGGTDNDRARSIQQTLDGGYIVAGWSGSFSADISDIWVLKLSSTGDVEWQNTYGGNDLDSPSSVQQTSDGGYIVVGFTWSFGAGNSDIWVLKLDSTGAVTWQKTYGGTGQELTLCGQQTLDGGFIVAGWTDSFGAGGFDVWVLKVGVGGAIAWDVGSGASTQLTRAAPKGTSMIGVPTWVTPVNSTATTASTTVTAQGTDATVMTQASLGSTASYWAKTYGGSDDDKAWSIQQTSDGGYIVAGYTNSSGAGLHDVWVLKLNSTGGVTWEKTYGGSGIDEAYSVQQTFDGGYIVAGWTNSSGVGSHDAWVFKLYSNGDVEWQNTYGGSNYYEAYSVQQTSDGGYIVAGAELSCVNWWDAWVLRLSSTGDVTWQKTYGGTGADFAEYVQQTWDGGYIVAGITSSFGLDNDIWVLKLDSSGDVTWQEAYGGNDLDGAYSIQQTWDGGYIVAGETYSFGAGYDDVWVLKLDSSGDVTWQNTYGGIYNDGTESIQQTSDGGYIVGAGTNSFGTSSDLWVLKLNSTGDVTWQKTYGGSKGEALTQIQQTSDEGYIAAGWTKSFGADSWDAWVLKLGADGNIVWDTSCGASTDTTTISPVASSATITVTNATAVDSSATVGSVEITTLDTDATVKTQAPDLVPPATIGDLATSSSTATSITLTWIAPGNDGMTGNATGYVVKYSTEGPIDSSNWGSAITYPQSWTPAKNGTLETEVVLYLSNDTRYWFAVEAFDDAPTPNYSDVSNSPYGVTADAFPPARITDLATSSPTFSSITLTWTAPGDNGTLGTATGYVVKYSTTGPIVTGADWNNAMNYSQSWMPLPAGSTETYDVTDLYSATTYWFAIEAYDEASNYGDTSNSPTATTLTPPPEYLKVGVKVGDTANYSISITGVQWVRLYIVITGVSGTIVSGNLTAYFSNGTVGMFQQWSSDLSTGGGMTVTFLIASNLTAGKPAYAGSPMIINETIPMMILGATRNLNHLSLTNYNGQAEDVYWDKLTGIMIRTSIQNLATSYWTNMTLTSTSTWSDVTPPSAIDDLTTSSPTNSSITLTWTAPGDDGMSGNATGYIVKYSTTGPINASNWESATTYGQSWTPAKNGTIETYVITELYANTTYWFAIEAYDDVTPANYGDLSNSPSGRTSAVFFATPTDFFGRNGFAIWTNGSSVVITSLSTQPSGTGSPPSKLTPFVYFEMQGSLAPGSITAVIRLYYNRTMVSELGLNESTLALYTWNSTTSQWNMIPTTRETLNATYGVLIAYVNHFSYFAVFAATPTTGIGTGTLIILVGGALGVVVVVLVAVIYVKRKR
jgi:uncharacterized delta-60 repeat protein